MLLAIDIGNTHIKFGLFRKERLMRHWQTVSSEHHTGKSLFKLLHQQNVTAEQIDHTIIGSVVPTLTPIAQTFVERYLHTKPVLIGPETTIPVKITCNRRQLGADRLADVTAAYNLYGKPAITIGLGTATVLNVIDKKGIFIGGVIACGLHTSTKALTDSAALLPKIDPVVPPHTIGTNTVENMQSGSIWGHVSLVEGMIDRIHQELEYTTQIIATGGAAEIIAGHTKYAITVHKHLTLEGLRLLGEHHQKKI